MSVTDKFGQLPKKLDAPRATPGVLKIGIKSCAGLSNAEGTSPYCVLYNPSGIEVLKTPSSNNSTNPEFPMSESKATLMLHNEHGNVKVVVKDKDTIIAGVHIPVDQILVYEGGVLTVALGSPAELTEGTKTNKGLSVFSPFRVVKGETPIKSGYLTIQYQYTAGGTCKEPEGTKPAEPFKEGELKPEKSEKKRRDKTPDPSAEVAPEKEKKKKDKTPEPSVEEVRTSNTLTFSDQTADLASLPPITEKPILRVDSIVSMIPPLASAQLYFADTFQHAADPVNGRNNKVSTVVFVTRTHLFMVDANQIPLRCVPLKDIRAVLTKTEKVCVKCSEQHDFYGELSSADSAKSLGSVISSLASSLGGTVALGDLKEVKSHQWAPKEGYALTLAAVHTPPQSEQKPERIEPKEKKPKTPTTEATIVSQPDVIPAKVDSAPQITSPASSKTEKLSLPQASSQPTASDTPAPAIVVSPPKVSRTEPLTTRARFERYCAKYIPDRLPSLDIVLKNHAGREEELMAQLVRTYGPEPNDDGPAALDPSDPYLGRLTRLFAKYQPARMPEAPYLLRQYKNREEELLTSLSFVYGPEPSDSDTAVPTSTLFGSPMSPARNVASAFGLQSSTVYLNEGERPKGLLRVEFPFTQPAPAGSETNFVRPAQGLCSMMPSLNFAAVLWAGHIAYQTFTADNPTPTIRVMVGILTSSHVYVGADFHYERCIPIKHIERFYLRAKLRTNSTHVRVVTVIQTKSPEPDCCFEFADQQEAERMISITMRLAQLANPHHAIDTAPFETTQESHFKLAMPHNYRPHIVEPLPLLPEYVPIMGRYRQRLVDIYHRAAVDKLEDVDRVLYMFPHEEEKMVAKLQETYGGQVADGDDSDIIGIAHTRHAAAQKTFLQRSSGSHPPPFLDAPEQEVPSKYSFLDPSPTRSSAPTVGRYTVGSPLMAGVSPGEVRQPKMNIPAHDLNSLSSTSKTELVSVADLLKAQGFSILSFNRAAAESALSYRGITAANSDFEVIKDIRYRLAQCGDDELKFLELIRGGTHREPQRADLSLRNPSGPQGTWVPSVEPLESSSAGQKQVSSMRHEHSRPTMTQLTQQHPLWPYL